MRGTIKSQAITFLFAVANGDIVVQKGASAPSPNSLHSFCFNKSTQ